MLDVYLKSFSCDLSVIAFSETWLKPTIGNLEIFCSNYQVFRNDRIERRGGGVLIAVHSSIPSSLVLIPDVFNIETVCVRLTFSYMNIFVICSYIPPSLDSSVYSDFACILEAVNDLMSARDVFIVCGDFNIPDVSWLRCSEGGYMVPSSHGRMNNFFDVVSSLGLMQINNVFNVSNRLLDLIYSNINELSLLRTVPFVSPEDKYHPTLLFKLDLCVNDNSDRTFQLFSRSFNFSRANFGILRESLNNVLWPSFSNDFSGSCVEFYEILYSYFCLSVPVTYCNENTSSPPWYTKELRYLKNRRNRLYKKFKISGSAIDYLNYSTVMHRCDSLNRRLYEMYLLKVKSRLNSDPKGFYNFVNSKRKVKGYPASLNYRGTAKSSDCDIADLFASFFQSTYVDSCDPILSYPYRIQCFDLMFNLSFSYHEVYSALLALKPSTRAGPDGVPAIVLRECADFLFIPLTKMFNRSLSIGVFPEIWKESFIVPLFKSGCRSNVENYRGIAKLSAIPKLFEQLITRKIVHSLSSIVSPSQHGFLKGKSAVTNLLEFTSYAFSNFSSKLQTDTIYTDFSKAFDRVDHSLLLLKLDLIGFPVGLINWLSSYLLNRTQLVLFKGTLSRRILVTSGVPQGSHLGPILFNLFVNDLPSVIHNSSILMYADDVKLFRSLKSSEECSLLQDDLNRLVIWCESNHMLLNLSKCKKMSFNRGKVIETSYMISENILENVSSFCDLGITLDPKLNFNSHIDACVSKSSSVLGFIKRWSREFDDPYLSKRLFTSLVRPILEYGSLVWSPYYSCHVNRIESVQKQFLLFALRSLAWNPNINLPPYLQRLALINLPTLERRRIMLGVCFIVKLINGEINSPDLTSKLNFNVPFRVSRQFSPLNLPAIKYNYEELNPIYKLCKNFNKISNFISITDSIESIKLVILNNNVI